MHPLSVYRIKRAEPKLIASLLDSRTICVVSAKCYHYWSLHVLTETCFGIAQEFVKRFRQWGHERELEESLLWAWREGARCCCGWTAEDEDDKWVVNRRCEGRSSTKCLATEVVSGRDPKLERLLSPSLWLPSLLLDILLLSRSFFPCSIVFF